MQGAFLFLNGLRMSGWGGSHDKAHGGVCTL